MSKTSIEAARYALLRRLGPAIRHRVVGKLHPIGLIAEALEWQMQDPALEASRLAESIGKINGLSRTAMLSFTSQITWLVREERALTTLAEGIDECLSLLHTDFELRGFAIRNEVPSPGPRVSLNAIRNVLAGALIAISDAAPGPAKLTLTAEILDRQVMLSVLIQPTDESIDLEGTEAYRRLEWSDVEALAEAESVAISRRGERVDMRYNLEEKVLA